MRLRLGLRTKFFLYSNTLIVATMSLVTVLSVIHEENARQQAIDSRGRSIVDAMAISVSDALVFQAGQPSPESSLIDQYIAEILSKNPDVMRWVVVADTSGEITHSTDSDLVGRRLEFDPGEGARPQRLPQALQQEETLQVSTGLRDKHRQLGVLVVGFSLEPVRRQVEVIARRAILIALVLMVFNSLLTAVYVETLIRPILNLNETMRWAGRGDLAVRARVRGGDEVGELTEAFNRMMDELEAARDREEVQRDQLAHTEKMAAIGTLAAGVAHEVNNPLAGVLACLENMQANPTDVEMRERYVALIRDGLERIERTVTNLLNFSRQRGVKLEPTSINHCLHHVVELGAYQLRKANVEVRYDLAEDGARVMADHFQIEQLFLNLVLNAVQAMPDGGTLSLRTTTEGDRVMAEVRDSGQGISAAIRERIFDPFFTTRHVGEGTGLGLAVSDSIVSAHGGTIEVESSGGGGTMFRVTLEAMAVDSGEAR